MSDSTTRLNLPYLMPNQAQKHVTLNESLARLDVLVQGSVISASIATQPVSPSEGDQYILPPEASGDAWSLHDTNMIAAFQDGAWQFLTPGVGWDFRIVDETTRACFDGSDWVRDNETFRVSQLGVNTVPNATNRFCVKSDAELLSHDDLTPGSGDARKIINKSSSAHTASLLLQTDWSGRAEIGLVGEDNLALKVSADGAGFLDAARFSASTGTASFPQGLIHQLTGAPIRSLLPIAGGDGISSIYRINPDRAENPRTYSLSAVSANTLTLTTTDADTIFTHSKMAGVSMLRIWNVSKSPAEPAWVTASSAADSIDVLNAASVATWTAGETIQLGDPTSQTPGNVIAIDISPMMQSLFGAVFPQAGVSLKVAALPGSSGESALEVSPNGGGGTFISVRGYDGAPSPSSQLLLACDLPSPVSDSNLVCLRETAITGDVGISIATVLGLLV
ncbi:DUF2793 domain-containing protein [Henriciella sp. AS95]|uniref:DUF2793 domain-containing protein n=1 Tax=Henriciella sp. AS95 TaxID=3135782 RepID=UPI00316F3DE5